uniref:Non-specific lipid-transfer protein n=1 Tax=Solanum tuberosum TaxID=4113 RepID=M1BVB5_SOLTU
MLNSKKLLLSFLLICMVVMPPPAKVVAITCGTVHNIMHPYCHKYALFGESFPSECCNELKSLISNITISADRQSVCSCMKGLASTEKQVNRLASIPELCGANLPFKIGKDVDCSKVN